VRESARAAATVTPPGAGVTPAIHPGRTRSAARLRDIGAGAARQLQSGRYTPAALAGKE